MLAIYTGRCIVRGMDFKTFFMSLSVEERDAFAARCETSRKHLTNVVYGKTCGESLCINIERESCGQVRCESLRPDVDWSYLRQSKKAA